MALWVTAAYALLGGLLSLVPRTFGHVMSDGRQIASTLRAARLVPGGATALTPRKLEALVAAVNADLTSLGGSGGGAGHIVRWIQSAANDKDAAGMRFVYVRVVAGAALRLREGARRDLPPDVAAETARGSADPVAAAAVDRYARTLAASTDGGAAAKALRYWLVAAAPSRQTALESLRWLEFGRALADVFAMREAQAAAAPA
jgi:hypothetical protein